MYESEMRTGQEVGGEVGADNKPGIGKMNLKQQQDAVVQLMADIPQAARPKVLYQFAKQAFDEGWIDQVPDAVMAAWSAAEKIRRLKRGRPDDEPEDEPPKPKKPKGGTQ